MGKLICTGITSADGYVNDAGGEFEWSAPDPQVFGFVTDTERPIGTYLYGRRLYEVMAAWETIDDPDPRMRDFASVWRAADKIVYSTTLQAPSTTRTRVERAFDPQAVAAMKRAAPRDLSVGGPGLAAHAFRAGLVDELRIFVTPVLVGGGTRLLPDGVRTGLTLLEERRFDSDVVYLRYAVSSG